MTYKLTDLDKKILYELGRNARQSYKEIAENIHSKKELVAYHINQLIADKIIWKFVPIFSITSLGIYSFKIYLKLHGLTKEAEDNLQKKLIENKDINWVAKAIGQWDLLIGMFAPNIIAFAQKKNELLSSMSQYIQDYDITAIEDATVFNHDWLIDELVDKNQRKEFVFATPSNPIQLSAQEIELIQHTKNNARFKILDISKELNQDPRTTLAQIKSLQKSQVLRGYTTFLNLKNLNLQLHKLCIYMGNHEEKEINRIIAYSKENPCVIHTIKSLGSWELELEIESDSDHIHSYIRELKNKFMTIKNISLVTITEELKLEFFPQNYEAVDSTTTK